MVGNGGYMTPGVRVVPLDAGHAMLVHAESASGAPPLQIFADVIDLSTASVVRSDRVDDPDLDGVLALYGATAFGAGRVLITWDDRWDYARSIPRHLEARVFHEGAWSQRLSTAAVLQTYFTNMTAAGGDIFLSAYYEPTGTTVGWSATTDWQVVEPFLYSMVPFEDGTLVELTQGSDKTTSLVVRNGVAPPSPPVPTGVRVETAVAVGHRLLLTWHEADVARSQLWSLDGTAGGVETFSPDPVAFATGRFGSKSYFQNVASLGGGDFEWLAVVDECASGPCVQRPYARRLAGDKLEPLVALPIESPASDGPLRLQMETEWGPIFDRPDGTYLVPRMGRAFDAPVRLAATADALRAIVEGKLGIWLVSGIGSAPTRFGRYDPTTHAVSWVTIPGLILPISGYGIKFGPDLQYSGFEDPLGALVLVNDVLDGGASSFLARWDGASPPRVFPRAYPGMSSVGTDLFVPRAPDARSLLVPSFGYLDGSHHTRAHVEVFNVDGVSDIVIDPASPDLGTIVPGPGPSLAIGCGGITTLFAHGKYLSGYPVYRGLEVAVLQ